MRLRSTLKGVVVGAAAGAMVMAGAGVILRADAQTPPPTEPPEQLVYVSVAPERILDTRNGNGDPRTPAGQKIGAGQSIELDVAGRTLPSGVVIPEDAAAVMVNATITEASERTFVTFHPAGTARPEASSLNAVFGQNLAGLGSEDVPNMITVDIGDNGNVAIFNFAGATHVLADIAGYFVPAAVTPEQVSAEVECQIRVGGTALPTTFGTTVWLPFGSTAGIGIYGSDEVVEGEVADVVCRATRLSAGATVEITGDLTAVHLPGETETDWLHFTGPITPVTLTEEGVDVVVATETVPAGQGGFWDVWGSLTAELVGPA